MKGAFVRHLEKLHAWLDRQEHIKVLRVGYKDLIERPELMASRVAEFLGGQGDVQAMAAAVDRRSIGVESPANRPEDDERCPVS